MKKIFSVLVFALFLGGYLSTPSSYYGYGPNQTWGTVVGAGFGGIVGSQIGKGDERLVATSLGVLYGHPVPTYSGGYNNSACHAFGVGSQAYSDCVRNQRRRAHPGRIVQPTRLGFAI